ETSRSSSRLRRSAHARHPALRSGRGPVVFAAVSLPARFLSTPGLRQRRSDALLATPAGLYARRTVASQARALDARHRSPRRQRSLRSVAARITRRRAGAQRGLLAASLAS